MKVIITGAAGFIGSHVAEKLLARGDEIVALDIFDDFYDPRIKRANLEGVLGKIRLYEDDIRDREAMERIFEEERPEAVVHLAARAGVRPSLENPPLYVDVNINGTMSLLEAARRFPVENFVFTSSSSVYGNNEKVPFSEDDPVDHPVSPYAATKKAGELLCHTYHHLYNMNITCIRPFTVYGPRQRPEMAIHKFTRLMLRGEELPLFGDGTTERDYTYIDDLADGYVKAVDKPLGYEVVNFGESRTISLSGLVSLLGEITGAPSRGKHLPEQPGDVRRTYADVSKAVRLLGYEPRTELAEGLGRFVDWYRAVRAKEDRHDRKKDR